MVLQLNNFKNLNSSTLIFETIKNCGFELDTGKASMWEDENPFSHPPVFRFRLKDYDFHNEIYTRLKSAIESYQGNLNWTLIGSEIVHNYIIVPKIFYNNSKNRVITRIEFLSDYSQDKFEHLINNAINDVDELAVLIFEVLYKYKEDNK